jgi:hypothetical protein
VSRTKKDRPWKVKFPDIDLWTHAEGMKGYKERPKPKAEGHSIDLHYGNNGRRGTIAKKNIVRRYQKRIRQALKEELEKEKIEEEVCPIAQEIYEEEIRRIGND